MNNTNERKPSLVEIVGLPVLAAGAGSLVGGIAGGAATRKVLDSPGVSSRLKKMTPEQRRALVHRLHSGGAALAGTASALGSYALSEHIREQMERRKRAEEKK